MLKSILKSKLVTWLIFKLLVGYIWLLLCCCRKRTIYKAGAKEVIIGRKPAIITCWHSRFMILLANKEHGAFHAVTSAHRDGNYLQMLLEHYGHHAIRGSSRKHASSAMREILRLDPRSIRLVITPDGPLGPRFKVKGGVLRVARRFDVPIIPVTYSATNAIVLKTWDRFILPIPFISQIVVIMGTPLSSIEGDEVLENDMIALTQEADRMCGLEVDY